MRRLIALGLALALAPASSAVAATAPSPSAPAPAVPPPPVVREDLATLAACLQRFEIVGLPRLRSEDARAEQAPTVICRDGYALSYDLRTHNPDWVVERLTPDRLRGKASRSNRFLEDPLLSGQGAVSGDFTGTGYDRGHQAPAADSAFSQSDMNDSFYMSNMSPQVGIGFNRGQWKYLEEEVRAWVLCGGRPDVLVTTGPIYGASRKTISAHRILVPEAYYKIVYDTRQQRAVGFKLFNRKYDRTELRELVVPISQIEDETGIDFFPALSRRKQNQLETPKGIVWGHEQRCSNVAE